MDIEHFQKIEKEQFISLISEAAPPRYKCNLCLKVTPRVKNKALEHIQLGHLKYSKEYRNDDVVKYILFCKKGCIESGHYHCFVCNVPFRLFAKLCTHISTVCIVKSCVSSDVINPENTTHLRSSEKDPSVSFDSQDTIKNKRVNCSQCGVDMLRKNLKDHVLLKHSLFKCTISKMRYHDGVCLDQMKGLYLVVNKLGSGTEYPIHVQKLLNGQFQQIVKCDSKDCISPMHVAGMSGHASYECNHAQSVQYVTAPALKFNMTEEGIDELISMQRVKEENKGSCLSLKHKAELMHELSVGAWVQEKMVFMLVWTGEKHDYSPMGRVVISFDRGVH